MSQPASPGARTPGVRAPVLLVDDRETNLDLLEAVLDGIAIEPLRALSGEQAVEIASGRELALVVLDVHMPGMDGLATASSIRERQRFATPIIFVTAYSHDDEKVRAGYAVGAVDYIFKPIDPQMLRAKAGVFVELFRHRQELERVNTELERSNAELDQFAYAASHDLKAPLRAVHQLAACLRTDLDAKLSEPSQRYLDLLVGRVGRMSSMVDALLAYSRVGRTEESEEIVPVHALCASVVQLLGPPPGIEVTIDAQPDLVVETPRAALQQVLLSLVGNAIKHHGGTSGRIVVRAKDDGGDLLRFEVEDDGPGVPPRAQKRIFEMFCTLRPPDGAEGGGMGLALVAKRVALVGGTLGVESDGEGGSTFYFTWPRSEAARGTRAAR